VEIDLLKMQRNRVQMRLTKIVLTVMTPMLNRVSASTRKINVIESPNWPKESPNATGYRFIDIEILSEVFQQVVYKECGESSSLVLEDKK
jgi:hypothetical protein